MARSWRYRVTGEFRDLPPLDPRPLCTACVLGDIAVREDVGKVQRVTQESDDIPADIDEGLRPTLELGRRVGRYLAIVGADEADGRPSSGPSSAPRSRASARTPAIPGVTERSSSSPRAHASCPRPSTCLTAFKPAG